MMVVNWIYNNFHKKVKIVHVQEKFLYCVCLIPYLLYFCEFVNKFCNVLSSIAHAAVVSQSLLVDLLVELDF